MVTGDGVDLIAVDEITVLALTGYGDVPVTDPYVDRCWLPVVGPTAIALLRFVAREDGQVWQTGELARAVGLGQNRYHLAAAMGRAERFRLARWLDVDHSFNAKVMLPPLPSSLRSRVPARVLRVQEAVG